MRKTLGVVALAVGGAILFMTGASAAVSFDPTNGTGFVGKGDVQDALGWNNSQLQTRAAGVTFALSQETVADGTVSWVCTNENNENVQVRQRTTTTTITTSAVVGSVARDSKSNQITGFALTGYGATSTSSDVTVTDGPSVNSCPSGPWRLTSPAGEPEVASTTTGTLNLHHGTTTHPLYVY